MFKQLVNAALSAGLGLSVLFSLRAAADCGDMRTRDWHFVMPNELHPEDAWPIYSAADPRGAVVSVGTERGFIAAAMTMAPSLYLIDVNPNAVWFNLVNIELLAAAHSLAHYRELRAGHSLLAWLSSGVRLTSTDYERWRCLLDTYQDKLLNQPSRFVGVNYTRDEILFEHLQDLARRGKISVVHLDLNDGAALNQFARSLTNRGDFIGLLDLSNAVNINYIRRVGRSLQALTPAMKDSSLLSITSMLPAGGWTYIGYSWSDLKRNVGTLPSHRSLTLSSALVRKNQINPASSWSEAAYCAEALIGVKTH